MNGNTDALRPLQEKWCLYCDKAGHQTHECWSTQAINTPEQRELARLCECAAIAAQAEPQVPLPEFECAHQYATKRRLAVTREWIRGWDDCTDYIEGLLKARGIGKQEGK